MLTGDGMFPREVRAQLIQVMHIPELEQHNLRSLFRLMS